MTPERTYTFTVTTDEDDVWIAQCVEIPGIVTEAGSIEELGANAIEALQAVLEARAIDRERRPESGNAELTWARGLIVSGVAAA